MPKRRRAKSPRRARACCLCGAVIDSEPYSNDDGPPPMKNMKPTIPNPTAKDHFLEEHQGEYEKREQSTNKIIQVEQHNEASPKLKDELDKRRDTTRTDINTKDKQAKVKSVRYSDSNKRHGRSRENGSCKYCDRFRKRRPRRKYDRVGKNRNRRQNGRQTGLLLKKSDSEIHVLTRKLINTASSAVTLTGTKAVNTPVKTIFINDVPSLPNSENTSNVAGAANSLNSDRLSKCDRLSKSDSKRGTLSKSDSKKGTLSKADSKNYDLSKSDVSYAVTSNYSLASYHSFISQAHEPMVE